VKPLEGVTSLRTSRLRWVRTAPSSQPAKSPVASTVEVDELVALSTSVMSE
jgi:hypothetical protein